MIIIHAFIKVDPAHRDHFFAVTEKVVIGSKTEEGNITYHLYQDPKDVNSFVILEEWKNLDAIKFHRGTPHYKSFKEDTKDMFSAPIRVERYEVAGNL